MKNSNKPAPFDFAKVRWAYFGLLIGMFAASISSTIISPAVPRIVADLGGVQWYSWLSTIVMLVSAVVIPISGKLADIFGRRRFYIIGLLFFMLGSILSGLAFSFAFLVFARAIQGVGMGILMPLSQTILGDLIPPRHRGKYQGYMGAVMGAAQVAGPLFGGWMTDVSSWRWLFYVSLPIGLIALFIIVKYLHVPEMSAGRNIDYWGIVTMTIGVTSLLLGISFGGEFGWSHWQVLAMLIGGAAALIIFIMVEVKTAAPIVPMYLFKNSIFTFSTISALLMNMGLMSVVVYSPVYAQGVLGVSATVSGLILIPMNVLLFFGGVVIGNLTTLTGYYKPFIVAGAAVQICASGLLLMLGAHSTPLQVTLFTGLMGVGYGMASQLFVLAVQNSVPRKDLGTATATLQFFRNIGNTLGTAIAGTIMTTHLMSGIAERMTPRLEKLVPGGVNPNDVLHADSLTNMPPEVAAVLRGALADSMHQVFLILPFITVVAFVASLLIKALKLRDSFAQNDQRGREILDSVAMSSPDQKRVLLSPEDTHSRHKERILGAHLILLAEQVGEHNPLFTDAVAEFGGYDLRRGKEMLRSTGIMLLSEDPEIIDKHEPFAIEFSRRGEMKQMLSTTLTGRLDEIASRIAQEPSDNPTAPHMKSAKGIDGSAVRRALMMLDSMLVADASVRRWPRAGGEDNDDSGAGGGDDGDAGANADSNGGEDKSA